MILSEFKSELEQCTLLKELWSGVSPYINGGKVESRAKAYLLFADVLKISQQTIKHEKLNQLWLHLLSEGRFSLCIENREPINYNFDHLVELLKADKTSFDVKIIEVESTSSDLLTISKAIDSIALSSLGKSCGATRFQEIMASPNTMCLLAQERDHFIACTYGRYLELPYVKFFHFNFLGRKVEYPSVHIIEKLQSEVWRIQSRFPAVQYLSLCVNAKNDHMMAVYEKFGFQQIQSIESESDGLFFFYGKKIDQYAKPPSYEEYQAAIKLISNPRVQVS